MQASQPTNETRLPRAVLRRSAEIQARIDESKAVLAANAAPAADPAAPTEPLTPAPAVDPRESDPAYWKQRFMVTEGVLRKSREDHRAEVQGFRQQLSEVQEQVRTLQAKKADSEPETVELQAYFTPEQIAEYGEEQCQVMAKAAQKAARQQAQQLIDAEIKPLKEQQVTAQQDRAAQQLEAFQDALGAMVPDFREVDVSPGWLEWLAQEDVNTGIPRQNILDTHVHARNALKVGKMFQAYLASTKHEVPDPPVAPHGSGATGGSGEVVQLSPAGGFPSQAEIKDFYKRAALGRVKDDERAKFEARMKLG